MDERIADRVASQAAYLLAIMRRLGLDALALENASGRSAAARCAACREHERCAAVTAAPTAAVPPIFCPNADFLIHAAYHEKI